MIKDFMTLKKATGSIKEAKGLMKQIRSLAKEERPDAIEMVTDFLSLGGKDIKVKQLEKDVVEFQGKINNGDIHVITDRAKNKIVQTNTSFSMAMLPEWLSPYRKHIITSKTDFKGNLKTQKCVTEQRSDRNDATPNIVETIISNPLTGNTYKQVKNNNSGATEYFKKINNDFVQMFKKGECKKQSQCQNVKTFGWVPFNFDFSQNI